MSMTTDNEPRIIAPAPNPFAKTQPDHLSAGAVAIQSERAVAEAQGKLILAKRFPRDEAAAFARVMDSCRRPTLAKGAVYKFPRGGQSVSGPSIRLAEELARCWGNIDYGLRELSRREGESEMEAFAWDLQTNTMSVQSFTVRHLRDKRGGPEALRDERDIYEVTANMGARRLRARILAILPPDLVDAALEECRITAAGDNTVPFADQVKRMTQAFAAIGVTADMLAARLGHPLDATTPDELADLREIYNSISDGVGKASEFFGGRQVEGEKQTTKLDALDSLASTPLAALIEKIEATTTNAEVDALLRGAKVDITAMSDEERAQLETAVTAQRHGFSLGAPA